MSIHILSENLINKIAAGEVVERPASVIKELVENAIDAKSSQISIFVRDGGKSFIKVSDNGVGMGLDDLKLCMMRHATSKISTTQDLFNINTMGFRGEALPAIGGVSRMQVISKYKDSDDDLGWQITNEGGQISNPEPVKTDQGTTIEIKDLFFATPARLKFMKTATTELSHIVDLLHRISMAYPQITFTLHDGKRQVFHYERVMEKDRLIGLKQRVEQVIGADFAQNSCQVELEFPELKVYGFCSLPTLNRSSGSHQWFFVNGRAIKDKVLYSGVRAAYQDYLAKDRYPIVVLFLNLAPDTVDVNVHPAKAEVRFTDGSAVRSGVIKAIKQGLTPYSKTSSSTIADQALGYMSQSKSLSSSNTSNYTPNQRPSMAEKTAVIELQRPAHQDASQTFYQASNYEHSGALNDASVNTPKYTANRDEITLNEEQKPSIQEELVKSYPLGCAKAQLDTTYIIAETNNSIIIVDQHAAHERLNYEKMKQQYYSKTIKRQILLVPVIIDVTAREAQAIEDNKVSLKDMGIGAEKLSETTIMVREVPAILGKMDVKSFVLDIIDHVLDLGESEEVAKAKINAILSSMSCRGSIRAGGKLTMEEMNLMLRQMESQDFSAQCNHGRPTYVELKIKDVEKLFGRT